MLKKFKELEICTKYFYSKSIFSKYLKGAIV